MVYVFLFTALSDDVLAMKDDSYGIVFWCSCNSIRLG